MPLIEEKELCFNGIDPGAVRFGNFINYYTFHSTKERIEGLDPSMFPKAVSNETVVCLDIGCNIGQLTNDLYQYLKSIIYPMTDLKILAVDIDPVLIQRASELNDNPNISYMSMNITSTEDQKTITQYLDINQKKKFDIIFCFSVTMWIHINNGDDGLQDFLKYMKSLTRSIIIEPQPWKCYRTAQRRLKKNGGNFPLYEALKIRSNIDKVIEQTLLLNGDTMKVFESQTSCWDRKIQSFHNISMF